MLRLLVTWWDVLLVVKQRPFFALFEFACGVMLWCACEVALGHTDLNATMGVVAETLLWAFGLWFEFFCDY
jgi:hypothetical protein